MYVQQTAAWRKGEAARKMPQNKSITKSNKFLGVPSCNLHYSRCSMPKVHRQGKGKEQTATRFGQLQHNLTLGSVNFFVYQKAYSRTGQFGAKKYPPNIL